MNSKPEDDKKRGILAFAFVIFFKIYYALTEIKSTLEFREYTKVT